MNRTFSLFLLHIFATVFMTGVIWIVQVVHYPLFAQVGRDGFAGYQSEHERRISWVVGPMMLLELASAILLAGHPPAGISRSFLALNLGLLALIWLSTSLLQVPQHQKLEAGFEFTAYHALVLTNWLRTVLWSIRSVLLFLVFRPAHL